MEFQFGDWLVSPEANLVSKGDVRTQLEPRVMAVLRYLCRHPGAVIPAEEILQACWGSNELGDNPVHKAIAQLRRAFDDSSTEPRYIETIRKRGYRAIAPVVTLAANAPMVWDGGSPFRGLESFQENHAAIFFGRVAATAQLRELVLAQASQGHPLALVLGPSGSGKTSLVRAGLLPQLMAGAGRSDEPVGLLSSTYLDCADLGSGTLFQALAGALIDIELNGQPLFPGASAHSLGRRLASDLDAVVAELRALACARATVGVFVDRLEAIFRAPDGEAARFLAVIEELARSNCLLVVMACRNDFYPDVMAQPVLLALKSRGGHFDVLPPDGAEIAQIVRQPAQAASLNFEVDPATGASLDDVLCDAARGNPDMLPMLQYTLNELYRQRSEDGTLRLEVYRQLGGIEGAVGVRAEQVVSALLPAQIAALPHVLSLLVNVGEDQSSVTSRRSPLSMLHTEDEKELVRVMVEARLFVSELAGDVPSFGVAHEALLRQWPRVVAWVEQYRNALQLRTRLTGQARRWINANRSRDLLLPRGVQVSQAADLLRLKDFALAPDELEYVSASLSRARLGERIRIAVTAVIGILAVLTTILGISARSAQREAEHSRNEAEGLMTFMLGDFVEKLRPIGRLDLLDDVGSKALTYLGNKDTAAGSGASLVSRIKALQIIAEVHSNRGRMKEARQALGAARELIQNAPPEFGERADFQKQAGQIASIMGQIHQSSNEFDEAERLYRESRDYAARYSALSGNTADALLEKSYAHNALGALAMAKADYGAAAREFSDSLKLKQEAARSKPLDDQFRADLAITISWNAESILKLGNPREAMKLYREEEALLRANKANKGTASALAASLMRQALLSVAFDDRTAAAKSIQEAEQILKELVNNDPTNRQWQGRLLQAQVRLAEARLTPENAGSTLERILQLSEKLEELSLQDPRNSFLAYQKIRLGLLHVNVLQALGRHTEAASMSDAILSKLGLMHEKAKKDMVVIGFLAEGLLTRSELARIRDGEQAAQSYCRQTAGLLRNAVNISTDYSLLAALVRAAVCDGDIAAAAPHIEQLKKMGYQESRYTLTISTHPLLKGKL